MIYDKELDENLKVCPKCQHHFPIGSRERIHSLVETCTFEEMDAQMTSVDVLKFASYKSKLERDRKATMLQDAVVTGICKIGAHRVALGVMDFAFMGGSMGSVVGEKLTRLIERGTEGGLARHHHFHQRRRADAGRRVQPDADGQDLRRPRLPRQTASALTSAS